MTEHRPFDAREALMCESSPAAPGPRWRTAWVTVVRAIVAWSPVNRVGDWSLEVIASNPGTLLQAFDAAAAELTCRGLDADSLVRYGLRNEIVGSLLGLLVLRDLNIDKPEMVRQRGIDLDAWNRVLPNKLHLDPEAKISGNRYLGAILGETAVAAGRTQTREGVRHRRLARRRGTAKACVATGNTQLKVYHKLLSNPGMRYQDLGPDYYERQRDVRRQVAHHVGKLGSLGFEVTLCRIPEPDPDGTSQTQVG